MAILQENKLTGVAADLQSMVDKYDGAVCSLDPAEMELMMSDIEIVHHGLHSGHSRFSA
jgi:hypothetical protein